jgi:hypothetical protein
VNTGATREVDPYTDRAHRRVEATAHREVPQGGVMLRRTVLALGALALMAPGAAHAVVTIEGFYGAARPPEANFRQSLAGTVNDQDLSDDTLQIAGGDLLLNLGGFQLGAIVDQTFGDGVQQTAVGGLLGFRLGDQLRLDLLGEAGGHRFGSLGDNVDADDADQWLFYVGLRPGIAYRLGSGTPGLILGIWGFVRWDVTDDRVPLTVGGARVGDVDLGGTTIGATLRLGFEL